MRKNCRHFSTFTLIEHRKVKGVGGLLNVKGVGTICWRIEDDEGASNTIKIKYALYVPDLPICLLLPQHWIQQDNEHFTVKRGTWCTTCNNKCVPQCNQRLRTCTMRWYPVTNTGHFQSAAGTIHYRVYASTHDDATNVESHEHICYQNTAPHLIPDD